MAKKNKQDQKGILKRILSYIRPYSGFVVLSFLLAAVSVAMTLYIPILTGDCVDQIVGKGKVSFEHLTPILFKMLVLILLTALAQWIMNTVNNYITFHVVMDIRTKAYDHLNRLPLSYLDQHDYGDILSRIITDVDTFSDGLLMGFTQLFSGIITIAGTLLFMLTVNPLITLVVVALTPLSFVVASFISKRTYHMFRKQSMERAELTSFVDEMLNNQKVVKAFCHEKENMDRFQKINDQLGEYSLRAVFYSSITNPSTRFINALVYAGVGITGSVAAIRSIMTVGQLTCFLSYANQYMKPFNEISGVVTELQNAFACAKRVFDLIDEPEMEPDAEDAVVLTDVKGQVDVDDVSFSYRKDVPLIEHLSLHVNPGETVAIVGPTGCGKSTLINLLMRFYDVDAGDIRVEGNDIRKVTRQSLRANYGMVLQETWLKNATIAENIAYGKPEATREEIIAAAKKAHAHNFIRRMKDGYDTVLGEDGGSLSQGQKQLLCIARVMLALPPMLILDEATSSIDTRTEIKIQQAFEEMMKGRTSFIVAHRLSTIRNADCILVMKDGHIIEQGTHEQLLAANGFYKTLYFSQFAHTGE